jgi:hypothetical protein
VDNDLVFATQYGTELDAANVRASVPDGGSCAWLGGLPVDAPRAAAQFCLGVQAAAS